MKNLLIEFFESRSDACSLEATQQEQLENLFSAISDDFAKWIDDWNTPALSLGQGSFGQAIEAAKKGHKVARIGWNGSGMYAYIVPSAKYPAATEIAKKEFGEMVPYREYWALKTAQNDVATWCPSGSDSLAEDWVIVQ